MTLSELVGQVRSKGLAAREVVDHALARIEQLNPVLNAFVAVDAEAALKAADRIDRMDEALGWIPLIPRDRYVLRRIVGARSLVSPVTERHLFTWRRLGSLLGADHKAIQRWHAQGIAMIVAALNGAA